MFYKVGIEEGGEYEQRGCVHEQRGELGGHHEAVPRGRRQRHHHQLRQDQRRVADLHDVDQLVFEQD